MKKLLLAFLLFPVLVNAQNIRFSDDIKKATDPAIIEIRDLWQNYVNACIESDTLKINQYWKEKGSDVIRFFLSNPDRPSYAWGEHYTFNIRQLDNVFYEINTILELGPSPEEMDVLAIYSICAKKKNNNEYELFNYLKYKQQELNIVELSSIDYYYPDSYSFDTKKAKKANVFVDDFKQKYGISGAPKAKYMLSNNLNEANSLLGFNYTVLSSHLTYAGAFLEPNIILSCIEDHYHEIVHSLMKPLYPEASALLHEGIANYYGGSSGRDYKEHLVFFKEFVRSFPEVDFSDFNSYNILLDGKTNPYYTVGAIIIENALKSGGEAKVKELFKYSSTEEVFTKGLGIPKEDIHSYIYNLFLSSTGIATDEV